MADIWNSLTEAERASIAEEVALNFYKIRHLANIRMVPRTYPESPNLRHSPIFRGFDFDDARHQERNTSIFRELTLAMDMADTTRSDKDKAMVREAQAKLFNKMPSFWPFIFTHGNLRLDNIFVSIQTRQLTCIAGWEKAEYAPAFWEYTSIFWDDPQDDTISILLYREWRKMLRAAMEKLADTDLLQAGNWVKAVWIIRNRHHIHPARMHSVLEYLSSDYYNKELEPYYHGGV